MGSWIVVALTIGGFPQPMSVSRADDLPFALSPAVAEDRRRLADAIKTASRCGEEGRLSAADFDAVISLAWSRKAVHLYILPLDLEDALRQHDQANPEDRLGGPPLDFHAVDKNLVLCMGGVHDMIQETLCEYLTSAVGQKVEPSTIGRIVVDHLKGLPAKSRTEFIAKLVVAQRCLRSAAKESALGLVSDEADCEKVMKRVYHLGEEPAEIPRLLADPHHNFKRPGVIVGCHGLAPCLV